MAKTNIIPMQAEVEPIDAQISQALENLVTLFLARGAKALHRIREAEQTALERLERHVPTEPLLDIKQAAAYLGFTKRWLDEGTRASRENPVVPYIIIGGEKRFRKSSIDNALTSREVRPKKVSL